MCFSIWNKIENWKLWQMDVWKGEKCFEAQERLSLLSFPIKTFLLQKKFYLYFLYSAGMAKTQDPGLENKQTLINRKQGRVVFDLWTLSKSGYDFWMTNETCTFNPLYTMLICPPQSILYWRIPSKKAAVVNIYNGMVRKRNRTSSVPSLFSVCLWIRFCY